MVIRGMTISLPWFAFINVSFALIILLRRVLFNDLTPPWLNEKSLIHSIDISATGILLICSGLLLIPRQKTLPIQVLLVALSLLWSWCSYHFIAYWTLQFAYPLCVLLMLSGVIALYFHTPSLLAFVIPLWFTTPIASLMLNQQINIHFAVVWCI